jgi:hypothetical protein
LLTLLLELDPEEMEEFEDEIPAKKPEPVKAKEEVEDKAAEEDEEEEDEEEEDEEEEDAFEVEEIVGHRIRGKVVTFVAYARCRC